LKIESKVLENTGHSGTKGEGFSRGLQFVFKRNEISPSQSLLTKYAGKYQFTNGSTCELKVEGAQLVLYLGNRNKFVLKAESETSFFTDAEFLNLQITEKGIQVNRYNDTQVATKIK